MLDILQELYRHQAWADASQWRAVMGSEAARADADLKARLLHIHGVQQVWLGRWQGVDLGFPGMEDHAALEDTLHFAQACHAALDAFLSLKREADLAAPVRYRNLAGEAFTQPLGDLMLHLPMHSQYHRGQTAMRLRQLGSPAASTDLVTWQRNGRPAPEWP